MFENCLYLSGEPSAHQYPDYPYQSTDYQQLWPELRSSVNQPKGSNSYFVLTVGRSCSREPLYMPFPVTKDHRINKIQHRHVYLTEHKKCTLDWYKQGKVLKIKWPIFMISGAVNKGIVWDIFSPMLSTVDNTNRIHGKNITWQTAPGHPRCW